MTFLLLDISILIAFWVYFFVYSYRRSVHYPWGFGIVIVGFPLAGLVYDYNDTNNHTVLSINLMLVVCLIGLFWNINNIKEQFYIRDMGKILRFIGIALITGLLLGLAMQITHEMKLIQAGGSPYTIFGLITRNMSIQGSVAEEFLITGYFLGYLKKYGFNQIFAIAFQSLFFTVLHVPRYSDDWIAMLIIFLFGVVSGCLAWKSNNLIPSFVLHVVVNLTAVLLSLMVV